MGGKLFSIHQNLSGQMLHGPAKPGEQNPQRFPFAAVHERQFAAGRVLSQIVIERFDLSLGSADLDILKTEQRHGDLERLGRVVRRAAARDVPVVTYFICGLADDTVDTLAKALPMEVDTLIYRSQFAPGTIIPMVVVRTRITSKAGHRIPDG